MIPREPCCCWLLGGCCCCCCFPSGGVDPCCDKQRWTHPPEAKEMEGHEPGQGHNRMVGLSVYVWYIYFTKFMYHQNPSTKSRSITCTCRYTFTNLSVYPYLVFWLGGLVFCKSCSFYNLIRFFKIEKTQAGKFFPSQQTFLSIVFKD